FHRIHYDVTHAGPDTTITAELLALDVDGTILGTLPVHDGDLAHLVSRTPPGAWQWDTRPNTRNGGSMSGPGDEHTVYAPVPLLHIKAEDPFRPAGAFCSLGPYLAGEKPNNTGRSALAG